MLERAGEHRSEINDEMKTKNGDGIPGRLSLEMIQLLNEEIVEAEVQSAIDAAAEEGMLLTREEAIKVLLEQDSESESETDA